MFRQGEVFKNTLAFAEGTKKMTGKRNCTFCFLHKDLENSFFRQI